MQEELLARLRVLERSVRRWKAITLGLGLALVLALLGGGVNGFLLLRQQRVQQVLHLEELRARIEVERAQLQIERQRVEQLRNQAEGKD